MRSRNWLLAVTFLVLSEFVFAAETTARTLAEGTLQPEGPPDQRPVRVDAGKSCVVDVKQTYVVNGTLAGSFDIDYRILVAGPCGSPVGTFDERWIARGNFTGTVNGAAASASFTYTATVKAGGEVSGQIVLGQGLNGDLRVQGNFAEGMLSYRGQLTAVHPEQK